MKILYLVNAFNLGGAEIGLKTLVQGGLFDGFDLTVASLIRGSGELIPELQRDGVEPLILVDRPRMRALDLVRASARLFSYISKERPDIVVLSLPQANIIGRIIASALGTKVVISFEHNTHLANKLYEWMFQITSPLVDIMFSDSPLTETVVQQRLYLRRPKYRHIVPLISFGESTPPPHRPSPRPFRLVSAGRLTPVKNHRVLVQALRVLRGRGIEAHAEILGEGPLHRELTDLARNEGVQDLLSMPGFVSNWTAHNSYDAFVLTSLHEGLCIVALEAMHAGIPVVAPRVGGICDYGSDDNMIILDDRSPETIADAIEQMIAHPDAAWERSVSAQETVRRLYGAESVRRAYAAINKSMLDHATSLGSRR